MRSALLRLDLWRALFFILYAGAAAIACQVSGSMIYLAPFIATAALLANAGNQVSKALTSTLLVYGVTLLIAIIASKLMIVSAVAAVILCALAYLLCLSVSHQHPPAMALLYVLLMRPLRVSELWGLILVLIALMLIGMGVQFVQRIVARVGITQT